MTSPLFSIIRNKLGTAVRIYKKQGGLKKQYENFALRLQKNQRGFSMCWGERRLMVGDDSPTTSFDAHYLYHPAWAARVLAETKPREHTDISSILHFSAILSAFIPTHFYDYRPAQIKLSNFTSEQADLGLLPFPDDSVESLSCMHTIEHVGLGRYGDKLDPDGDLAAIRELIRVTRRGGTILFVVPVGAPKVIFNAHRIYSYEQILSYFSKDCNLKDFYLIPDNAATEGPIEHATKADSDNQKYGCGCFWFIKK